MDGRAALAMTYDLPRLARNDGLRVRAFLALQRAILLNWCKWGRNPTMPGYPKAL